MGMYFISSWLFIDEYGGTPFIRSWQDTLTLIILSYLLFLFSIWAFYKLKRKIVFFILISFCVLFFFLSGEYVTVTNMFRDYYVGKSDYREGYQKFEIEEIFFLFPIRSKTFIVKDDAYKFDCQDKFIFKKFPIPEGNFWVINGLGFCFRLHDADWSEFHLFYHHGYKTMIPPEKNSEDYK